MKTSLKNPFLSQPKVSKPSYYWGREYSSRKPSLTSLKREYRESLEAMFDPAKKDTYVILDTETTGVNFEDDRVIELSIINMDGMTLFSSIINPKMILPAKITELTGICQEELDKGDPFEFFAPGIKAFLDGKTVIAWNVDFDRRMVLKEFSRTLYSIECDWLCAMNMYHVLKLNKKGRWPKLSAAMEAEGITRAQQHRSLGDCLDTLAVLEKISGPVQYGLF